MDTKYQKLLSVGYRTETACTVHTTSPYCVPVLITAFPLCTILLSGFRAQREDDGVESPWDPNLTYGHYAASHIQGIYILSPVFVYCASISYYILYSTVAPNTGLYSAICNLRKYFGRTSTCLLYTSPSPRDLSTSRMPSSA